MKTTKPSWARNFAAAHGRRTASVRDQRMLVADHEGKLVPTEVR